MVEKANEFAKLGTNATYQDYLDVGNNLATSQTLTEQAIVDAIQIGIEPAAPDVSDDEAELEIMSLIQDCLVVTLTRCVCYLKPSQKIRTPLQTYKQGSIRH